MKKLNNSLNFVLGINAGFTASSIWITDSESWEISMPIFLLVISLKQFIND